MIETATGIVFRTVPITETSLVVYWLTDSAGRIATVAKGARRQGSPLAGKLDLFHVLELVFYRKRATSLHLLKEATLVESRTRMRSELGLLAQAAYAAALVEAATETDTPIPEVYKLFREYLRFLEGTTPQPLNVFAFEVRFLAVTGLWPVEDSVDLSPGAKQILKIIHSGDWQLIRQLTLSPQQVRELDRFLNGFIAYHLGRVPETRPRAVQYPG